MPEETIASEKIIVFKTKLRSSGDIATTNWNLQHIPGRIADTPEETREEENGPAKLSTGENPLVDYSETQNRDTRSAQATNRGVSVRSNSRREFIREH